MGPAGSMRDMQGLCCILHFRLSQEFVLQGDGLTLGGLMVIKKGGVPSYAFAEERFGDHASMDDVLTACKAASE